MTLLEKKHVNMEMISLYFVLKGWVAVPRESFSYGLESSFQVNLSDMGSGVFLPSYITSVSFH